MALKSLTFQAEVKVNDVSTAFEDIRLGQCFVSMEPSDALHRWKGRILIKMAKNRVQEVADDNSRLTIERSKYLKKCCLVHMPIELPATVLESLEQMVTGEYKD